MFNLNELDEVVEKAYRPSSLDTIYYLFWEKGISLEELERLPIPYIIRMVKVHMFIRQQEEKAAKRARRK